MGTSPLYEWSNVRVMAESEILQRKAIYLNGTFFAVRAVFYILVWGSLASYYFKHSRLQDVSGDVKHTRKLEIFSPAALILFALTVTFATFDWLMSLDPLWSSSIFAIYYFCGCVVASFAALILFALLVQAGGMLRHAITVEHYHDLGKLLFAFVVFLGLYRLFAIYAHLVREYPRGKRLVSCTSERPLEVDQRCVVVRASVSSFLGTAFAGDQKTEIFIGGVGSLDIGGALDRPLLARYAGFFAGFRAVRLGGCRLHAGAGVFVYGRNPLDNRHARFDTVERSAVERITRF